MTPTLVVVLVTDWKRLYNSTIRLESLAGKPVSGGSHDKEIDTMNNGANQQSEAVRRHLPRGGGPQ